MLARQKNKLFSDSGELRAETKVNHYLSRRPEARTKTRIPDETSHSGQERLCV